MSINPGFIQGAHHIGLPSRRNDWEEISAFWESLGMECCTTQVTDEDYDHAGAGPRLQVYCGSGKLVVSYYGIGNDPSWREFIRRLRTVLFRTHLALEMGPQALDAARTHSAFERETHWGHSNTSVFLTGPYGLHIELVTTNPDYHTHD